MAARDLVLTRFTARGTFLGHPPTGRVVTYSGFDMNRIEGGKIVESWVSYDALGLLQQLGLVPPIAGI
jgi:predicted ester cyclase